MSCQGSGDRDSQAPTQRRQDDSHKGEGTSLSGARQNESRKCKIEGGGRRIKERR